MPSETAHNSLREISIKNFRNLGEVNLVFNDGINLFVGDNGQGKTNCLEAIALACSLRPMQSLHNADMVKLEHEQAFIEAHFASFTINIDIKAQGKKASVDGKAIKSAFKLAEKIPIVSFIPLELAMLSGGAGLRRRALDLAANSLYFDHFSSLKAYEKIIQHRNRLLKSWPLDHSLLHTFTELLIEEGAKIIFRRLKTLWELSAHFAQTVKNILGRSHEGCITYEMDEKQLLSHTEADLKALLYEKSLAYRAQEQARRVTLFGPHLDDMIFYLDGMRARSYASRGQMRALVLAFKLAQLLAVHRLREHAPVVILDDIISELDQAKKANLIDVIRELGTQAFFSATDRKTFGGKDLELQAFDIHQGSLAVRL